jgi:single-stranded-DNA-specific exonuclease
MFKALQDCSDLITQFGGHAQAAGLSLPIANLPALKERLEQLVAAQVSPEDLKLKMMLDAEVMLSELTKKFVTDMENLEPFGHTNPQPTFYLHNVVLLEPPTLLKDLHVKAKLFADGVIKPIMFFNRPELIPLLAQQGDEPFDVAVHVVENHWNDRVSIELQGVDIANLRRSL